MEFLESLQEFLYRQNFRRIPYEGAILWVREGEKLSLVEIIPEQLPGQRHVPLSEHESQMAEIERQLMLKYQKPVKHLYLAVRKEMPTDEDIREAASCPALWYISRQEGALYLYENQITDYCGLKEPLERFLGEFQREVREENRQELRRMFTPVNTVLVLANVLVFVLLSFLGDTTDAEFMAEHGAMTWDGLALSGEFYRLLTSMFLHFGADHLLQNMLILLVIGCRLERITGKAAYLCIYLGAGLSAGFASWFFTLADNPYTASAGASGAIFGVMGGLLFYILVDLAQRRRGRVEEIGLVGILFMVCGALSYGFFDTGIDNAAHIGGLVGGFFFALFIYLLASKGSLRAKGK